MRETERREREREEGKGERGRERGREEGGRGERERETITNLFSVPDVISSVISTRTLFLSEFLTNSNESYRRSM